MPLQRLIRSLFAQFKPGGLYVPTAIPVPVPFGQQVEALGAMIDVGSMALLLNNWSQNLSGPYGNWAYSTVAGAAYTKTVAQELGGIHVHTGATGAAEAITLPTAALLYAGYGNASIGSSWLHLHVNLNTVGPDTITTAAGITLAGVVTVVTVGARLFIGRFTAVPVNIVKMEYVAGVVTLTTDKPHGSPASAIVANMSNAAFNGTFTPAIINAYKLSYPLTTAVAFATDPSVPNVSAQRPAVLNTAPTIGYQGCFAWPATMIA